jgi:paraquat-inducible protein A
MSREEDSLVVCEQCAMPHRWRSLAPGAVGRCVRCEATLGRGHRFHLPTVLALTVTAAVVFCIGLCTDVLTLEFRGVSHAATLPQAIAETWAEGYEVIAVVVALTALAAPALFIALRLYVLIPLGYGFGPCAMPTSGTWSRSSRSACFSRWCDWLAWPTRRPGRACSRSAP